MPPSTRAAADDRRPALSRSAFRCPSCAAHLAWKRAGGSYTLVSGVVAGKLNGSEAALVCPGCARVVRLPGVVLRLTPIRPPHPASPAPDR